MSPLLVFFCFLSLSFAVESRFEFIGYERQLKWHVVTDIMHRQRLKGPNKKMSELRFRVVSANPSSTSRQQIYEYINSLPMSAKRFQHINSILFVFTQISLVRVNVFSNDL